MFVVEMDGCTRNERTVTIDGRTYPMSETSALALLYYRVHHAGVRPGAPGRFVHDGRKCVHYASPEAYWRNEFREPADDDGSWAKALRAFVASDRVRRWEERRAAIRANPEGWIEEARKRV